MALDELTWNQIYEAIETGAFRPSELLRDVVVKRDIVNKLVWVPELGDQPVPIYAFDYQVTYYDSEPAGTNWTVSGGTAAVRKQTVKKVAKVEVLVPQIGETVLIALHYGDKRLPKCLGVLKSTNFILPDEGI